MSERQEPLVSVLTPVYNGEEFLAECIESVLAQTYSNWEYIIVNNCSTDRTLEIALDYAKKDSRIRVQSNDRFVGVIENHNIAFTLMSSTAKYCKVVSADDFLFPDCIAKMVDFAEANPCVGIIGSYQLTGNVLMCQGFTYPKAVFPGPEICRHFFFLRQTFVDSKPIYGFGSPTSILYRADLIKNSPGRFYPNSSPHADTSACFEQLRNSFYGFVYQVLSYERYHEQTQTSRSVHMNRHASAVLNDLVHYGPIYLGTEELDERVKNHLKNYHRYLATAYFFRSHDEEFWTYHRSRLAELGYPLPRFALLKAGLITILREALNPEQGVRKLWRHLFPGTADLTFRAIEPSSSDLETASRTAEAVELARRPRG
jgi:glycosyltransferase involved in cell wall biosynthesis